MADLEASQAFRYYVAPVLSLFSIIFCILAIIAHIFIKEIRKRTYNSLTYAIIIFQLAMAIHLMIQTFMIEYSDHYTDFDLYFNTIRGMIGAFITFGGVGYYFALSACMVRICTVFNAQDKMYPPKYHIPPIIFGFIILNLSTFALQDIGLKDQLFDGITDGSISELFHIIVIFIILPYSIYSAIIAYLFLRNSEKSNISPEDSDEKELPRKHIIYVVIFICTWGLASFAELLPMLIKSVHSYNNEQYTFFSYFAVTLVSLSGLYTSLARISDSLVQEQIVTALDKIFSKYSLVPKYEFVEANSPPLTDIEELDQKSDEDDLSDSSPSLGLPGLNNGYWSSGSNGVNGGSGRSKVRSDIASGTGNNFISLEEKNVFKDILGSMSGICLMIDKTYERFFKEKIFKKQIQKVEKEANKPASQKVLLKEKKVFYGKSDFTSNFVRNPQDYQNFKIEVKEYATLQIQNIRVLNKYKREDFAESLKPLNNEAKLKELFEKNAGRGGYPMFTTMNRKFILKQLSTNEKCNLIKTFVMNYHKHVLQNASFICRILGIFQIRVNDKEKVYFILMQNIDPIDPKYVDLKFDLKMSTVNRAQMKKESEDVKKYFLGLHPDYEEIIAPLNDINSSLNGSSKLNLSISSRSTKKFSLKRDLKNKLNKLKDMDFQALHGSLPIGRSQATRLQNINDKIAKDVIFLKSLNIMDYSLIITVARNPTFRRLNERTYSEIEENEVLECINEMERNGNCLYSPSKKFIYVFGIIDILQDYDVKKQTEGFFKKFILKLGQKHTDISCTNPTDYCKRFMDKMQRIFMLRDERPDEYYHDNDDSPLLDEEQYPESYSFLRSPSELVNSDSDD